MIAAGAAALLVLVLAGAPTRHGAGARSRAPLIVGAFAAAATVATAAGPPLVLVAAAMGWVGRRVHVLRARKRRAAALAAAYPDAIELLVLAIRNGLLPSAALRSIAEDVDPALRPAFHAVNAAVGDGTRFADALALLPANLGAMAAQLADSLAMADRYGLPLAPVLDRLADDARAQRRRAAEASARELPVRLAGPLVLCTLPSFVLIAIVPLLLGALASIRR